MAQSESDPVRQFREERGKFLELFVSAIIGGLAVGLLAAAATEYLRGAGAEGANPSVLPLTFGGLALLLITVWFLWRLLLRFESRDVSIKGFFVVASGKAYPLPEYEFAADVERYLRSARKELEIGTHQVCRAAAEYSVMTRLYTSLVDYLQGRPFDVLRDDKVAPLSRYDDGSSANEFFSLLAEDADPDGEPGLGDNGLFRRAIVFQVPCGTRIARQRDGALVVAAGRATVRLLVQYRGLRYSLHEDFLRYYAGITAADARAQQVDLKIRLRFARPSLFLWWGWEEYEWIDELIAALREQMDAELFLARVGGSATLTLLRKLHPLITYAEALPTTKTDAVAPEAPAPDGGSPAPIAQPIAVIVGGQHFDAWAIVCGAGLVLAALGAVSTYWLDVLGGLLVLMAAVGVASEVRAVA